MTRSTRPREIARPASGRILAAVGGVRVRCREKQDVCSVDTHSITNFAHRLARESPAAVRARGERIVEP